MKQQRDHRAEDGHFDSGWRLVRAGGWIKAAGCWFQSDLLLPYVDTQVWVLVNDYWLSEILCADPMSNHICKAIHKKRITRNNKFTT